MNFLLTLALLLSGLHHAASAPSLAALNAVPHMHALDTVEANPGPQNPGHH